jgi:hypothetical protein
VLATPDGPRAVVRVRWLAIGVDAAGLSGSRVVVVAELAGGGAAVGARGGAADIEWSGTDALDRIMYCRADADVSGCLAKLAGDTAHVPLWRDLAVLVSGPANQKEEPASLDKMRAPKSRMEGATHGNVQPRTTARKVS